MELFLKIVNGFQQLTVFAKSSIFDFWVGFEYPLVKLSKKFINLILEIYGDYGRNYDKNIFLIKHCRFSGSQHFQVRKPINT